MAARPPSCIPSRSIWEKLAHNPGAIVQADDNDNVICLQLFDETQQPLGKHCLNVPAFSVALSV